MTDIAVEEDESVRCGSNQARDVTNVMAGNAENVEVLITKIVIGLKSSDLEVV